MACSYSDSRRPVSGPGNAQGGAREVAVAACRGVTFAGAAALHESCEVRNGHDATAQRAISLP